MALLASVGIVDDPVIVRVLPSKQTCPHGRTKRGRTEGVTKPRPLTSESVDARCTHKRMARASEFIPPQVIDQDHHNVRPVGRGR